MLGFKDDKLNVDFEYAFTKIIMSHLIKCCDEMIADCVASGNMLHNNEDKITNRLVEEYLNKGRNIIRYIVQAPENYNSDEDEYRGRVDIKVCALDRFFIDAHDYYIIECKRINGGNDLNKKYVTDGVSRFTSNPPKYHSFRHRNMMLGYVVSSIDIPENLKVIDRLQRTLLDNCSSEGFTLIQKVEREHYIYSCQYKVLGDVVELFHIFYNYSKVVYK